MKRILIVALLILSSLAVFSSDLIIESKTQTFSDSEHKIKLDGGVKVKLDNLTVQSVRAEGEAQSVITEGNTPIVVINADVQEYDTKSSVMVCTGGVTIKYKDIDTYSDKAVIIADQKGGLRKIDLIGNAKVKQEQNESEGHHFVYNPITEEMSVSGNTKTIAISDDGKKLTIHSDYQQYSKQQNTYVGSGHVKVWYDDYYAQGPKVSVFPDSKTNKPNEIYFVGRSKIVQQDKDIIADKIKMTMDPKDFIAEGNVRTIIHNIDTKDEEDL